LHKSPVETTDNGIIVVLFGADLYGFRATKAFTIKTIPIFSPAWQALLMNFI